MTFVITVAYGVGVALLALTAARSGVDAIRRREAHRFDIFAVVTSLVLGLLLQQTAFLRILAFGFFLAHPFFLSRLIRHFRHVPTAAFVTTIVVAALGIAALALWPSASAYKLDFLLAICVGPLEGAAALALTIESRRSSGVTAKRLILAGVGTWFAVAILLHMALGGVISGTGPDSYGRTYGVLLTKCLNAGLFICYFFAFDTPRFLRARWQQAEQAKYLSTTSERPPEDRGIHAADDLLRAAQRSVGHAAILVALGPGQPTDALEVRAASGAAIEGTPIGMAGDHALARAARTREPLVARPQECGPELGSRLAAIGATVLVAPIVSTTHAWGVILVVQRRGSLFPDDDLKLLSQVARFAATALDHAQLVADTRDRERRDAARRLHEVESLMSLMLDSIKDYAMFVVDLQGNIEVWHPGAEHVFGYTSQEVAGEPAATLFGMTRPEFSQLLDQASQSGRASYDGMCVRRDGAKFIGTMVIRPLESGGPPGFVAVTRDVSERRELEARLNQSQKMEAVGQLAGGIAHDFNNLLLAIQGNADTLGQAVPVTDPRRDSLDEIRKATDSATSLTRQLLAFTRRHLLRPAAVNVSRLVTDLMPMLKRLLGEQIEIVHHTPLDVPAVLGDRGQVEQILINMAVNARDAMLSGGVLTINTSEAWLDAAVGALREVMPGKYVLLEIKDTGIGMDAATRRRIFEPFFTTKEVGLGTGLGLSTVYGIVKQMSGAVHVESEPGKGAVFQVYLPATAQPEVATASGIRATAPGGTETILLVEDDTGVRKYLADTLKTYGYKVLVAAHPAAAIVMAEAFPDAIDLMISDVVMPGRTGPELADELAEIRPNLRVLFISGYADGALARQGALPKATQFLQKPFSAADLLTRIRQVLT